MQETSPLLGVMFYRVAFDEGHSMGKGNLTNSLLMATSLYAKNRWLLTGTPTPSDSTQSLAYLFHQFDFLLHPILYTMENRNHVTTKKGEFLSFIRISNNYTCTHIYTSYTN